MSVAHVGQMRERITIQNRSAGVGGPGDVSFTWTDWKASINARVMPMRVDVTTIDDRLAAQDFWEVTIRYIEGVTDKQRIVWRGRNLLIKGLRNLDEHKRYLTLDCQDMGADSTAD